jgi:predicted nucleic acid-binding protein
VSRIYVDACCIIYLIEAAHPFHSLLVTKLLEYRSDPDSCIITSQLSRLECRARPVKDNDVAGLAAYDAFFAADKLTVGEISAPVIDRATELRARYGFSSPDAIHLASAMEEAADIFLTGDAALARCAEVKVEVLRAS